ncbi:MAG: transcription antitermination factor NusB [Kiritimatiellae bacterium]|nr:transcription antitermination factor NusB [Kiritimatiellia bacterium]
MNTRHEAREWAFQFLFQRDFNTEPLEISLPEFWDQKKAQTDSKTFAEEMIWGVEAHISELDEKIQEYAQHWDIKRMGAVDRSVMRIALYEMYHRSDIPPVVSINEAVEIAKVYSGHESGKFVNGILDRALKDIDRPVRTT